MPGDIENVDPYIMKMQSRIPLLRLGFTLRNPKSRVLPQQSCSPDLAPRDFGLFPTLKKKLRGRNFTTDALAADAFHKIVQQYSPKLGTSKPSSEGGSRDGGNASKTRAAILKKNNALCKAQFKNTLF